MMAEEGQLTSPKLLLGKKTYVAPSRLVTGGFRQYNECGQGY